MSTNCLFEAVNPPMEFLLNSKPDSFYPNIRNINQVVQYWYVCTGFSHDRKSITVCSYFMLDNCSVYAHLVEYTLPTIEIMDRVLFYKSLKLKWA